MISENRYIKPETVEQALRIASELQPDFKFLAGGTDLWVNKKQENETTGNLIDLTGLDELKRISLEDGCLKIGAMAALDGLANHDLVKQACPVLKEAIESVASPVIRKTATIGGNLLCENRCTFYNQSEWWRMAIGYCLKCSGEFCIATGGKNRCFSKFSSDLAICLMAMDAVLHYVEGNERRSVALESIYTGDGVKPRSLAAHALLLSVEIPVHRNFRVVYKKLRPRKSMDFSSLTSAVSLDAENGLRMVLGGVDPMPVLAKGEWEQKDELMRKVIKRARIVDNDFYSRNYRKKMISVYLNRSMMELVETAIS